MPAPRLQSRRCERIEAGIGRQMMRATGIRAIAGVTASFVGLFGTEGHHE
jgi:biopolymer transport protein ExbB/TolQ